MSVFRYVRNLYRSFVGREALEREFDEELRSYLDLATGENMKRGYAKVDAERNARLELGGSDQVREHDRAARAGSWIGTLVYDTRQVVAGLWRTPSLTITVIVSFSLAIGANTTIFSAVHSILIRPLPYPEPDRLVRIYSVDRDGDLEQSSLPDLLDWRNARSIEIMDTFRTAALVLDEEPATPVSVVRAAPEFLRLTGAQALHGRLIDIDDLRADAPRVIVLDRQFWMRRFGGDTGVIGQSVRLGQPRRVPSEGTLVEEIDYALYTVVGVAEPLEGPFPGAYDAVVPWDLEDDSLRNLRVSRFFPIIARLSDGATVDDAQAELEGIHRELIQEDAEAGTPRVVPLQEATVGDVRPALFALLGATGLILLVAVSNAANLLLARGNARKSELAMRSALGATRLRLSRFLLTEAGALALVGGATGIILASVAIKVFVSLEPAWLPRTNEISVDPTALIVAFGLAILAGLFSGLAPIVSLGDSLLVRGGIIGRERDLGHGRLGFTLIVAQIALSLVLLVGSGLMIRTFLNVRGVPVGFDSNKLVTFSLGTGIADWLFGRSGPGRVLELKRYRNALDHIRSIPGVEDVTLTSQAPLTTSAGSSSFALLSGSRQGQRSPSVGVVAVDENFFRFFDTRIIAGRGFEPTDSNRPDSVVVVDALTAKAVWGDEPAVGQRIRFGAESEVIGVVEPLRYAGLLDDMRPKLFHLLDRSGFGMFGSTVLVRHALHDRSIMNAIEARLGPGSDSGFELKDLQPVEALYEPYLREPRFYVFLMGALGVLALAVAMVGVYGTVTYSVTRRNREIGLRIALGARQSNVVGMFGRRVGATLVVGLAVGLMISAWLTRYLGSLLFETQPTEPATIVGASILIAVTTLAATAIPLRHAVRVDPSAMLRRD